MVPPNQAIMMQDALKEKRIPSCLIMFEGEQHGFRKKENIQMSLDAELSFYGKVFGFQPPASVPLDICNAENL